MNWPLSKTVCLSLALALASPVAPMQAAALPPREIKIIAATSANFRKNPEWKREIFERVVFANKIFQPRFGLRFTVSEYTSWEPRDETREMPALLEDLRALAAGGPDEIVAGFHKMSRPFVYDSVPDMDTLGIAKPLLGFVAQRDPFQHMDARTRKLVFVHELGHVFGAHHVLGRRAIMFPAAMKGPTDEGFDDVNARVIQAVRDVNLAAGAASLSPETLDIMIAAYVRVYKALPNVYLKKEIEELSEARTRMTPGALPLFQKAVLPGPAAAFLPGQKNAESFNRAALALYGQGKKEDAAGEWAKAAAIYPDDAGLRRNLAAAYVETGASDRAIAILEKLEAEAPGDGAVLGNLGLAYMKKREFRKASQYFYAALALNKKVQEASSGLILAPVPESVLRHEFGRASLALREATRAVAQLEIAKSLDPSNKDIPRHLAEAFVLSHSYAKAESEIKHALSFNGADPYLYALLSDVYLETGRKQKAVETARGAMKAADAALKALLYQKIAAVFSREGKYLKAFEELRASLALNPNDPETYYAMGRIYAKYRQPADARRMYRWGLEIAPEHAGLKRALKELD